MSSRQPVVLHVLEALGGGTSRHLLDLVGNAHGITHEVAVPRRRVGHLSDDSAVQTLASLGAVVHQIDMRRLPVHPANARALWRLRGLIRRRRPDIVHGHSSIGGALARVAALGAPAVRVYTPNGVATSAAALAVERRLGRLTERWIAVSASEGELASRLRLVDPDKVAVIPNGIDLQMPPPAVDLRALLGLPEATALVGCVCRLVEQKNPEAYVRAALSAAQQLPETHFVLVGDGPLAGTVHALADGAARFHHLTALPNAASVLGQLDLYCLSSRFEGGPYTPLEAMRAGTAVVLTDVVGNRDSVEPGVTGLLVPDGDWRGMAGAIVELMRDPDRRLRFAEAGAERLRHQFDVKEMGARHVELYRSLLT